MPLIDYQDIADRAQKGLGQAFRQEPWILNLPGKSVACKVDQYYYVVIMPKFIEKLAGWSGVKTELVLEALIKTGNLITKAPERKPEMNLGLCWDGKMVEMESAFVDADFMDRALRFYGGLESSLNVSELKMSSLFREQVESFFEGKTPPQALAYE